MDDRLAAWKGTGWYSTVGPAERGRAEYEDNRHLTLAGSNVTSADERAGVEGRPSIKLAARSSVLLAKRQAAYAQPDLVGFLLHV